MISHKYVFSVIFILFYDNNYRFFYITLKPRKYKSRNNTCRYGK